MSRVRDALKRANAMTPPAQTEGIPEVLSIDPEPEELTEGSAPLSSGGRAESPRYYPLLRYRWVRKLLRVMGLRRNVPVRKCQGLTRLGQPCRGPAMANGFCRLHGGSRQGVVAEKTRELIDRVLPAR